MSEQVEAEVIAQNMGWFSELLTTYKAVEVAKRSNPNYYSRANDNSRESVGTNEPRPNVTPQDPSSGRGVDVVAPTLRTVRDGTIAGISTTAAAFGGLFILGVGFLFAASIRS